MKWWMWDILVLVVIGVSAWRGWRKGLILSVAGLVIVLVSIWGAGLVSGKLANPVGDKLAVLFGFSAEKAYDETVDTYKDEHSGEMPDETSETASKAMTEEVLKAMGVGAKFLDGLVEEVWQLVSDNEELTLKQAIMQVATRMFSRVILFIFFFVIIMIALHILVHLVHVIFEIPVIKQLDQIGGVALGVITAVLLLFAIGWAIRYSGISQSSLGVEASKLFKVFVNLSPFKIF